MPVFLSFCPSLLFSDKWTPYEIALFESAICTVGKTFHTIAGVIKTKSTKEVVEFYYIWKESKNYAQWKASYRNTASDEGSDDD